MPDAAAVFSTYRVAALMDESMFDLPDAAAHTTKWGDPWLRWAKVGDYSGWYSIGERKPEFGERPSFWEAVLTLATEVGNGNLDAVHCIGPGILSVGGLGVTASSGYAQALLADCLEAAPAHFLNNMGRVIYESGGWVHTDENGNAAFASEDGRLVIEHGDIEFLVRRGGSQSGWQWTSFRKRIAKLWVESISRMLRHPKMDEVQARFCQQHIPRLMDPVRLLINWPREGIRDGWMFTREQQALWCVLMVAALEDEDQTWVLARDCIERSPTDARKSLQNLYKKVNDAAYTETFVARIWRSVRRVQKLFRIEVL